MGVRSLGTWLLLACMQVALLLSPPCAQARVEDHPQLGFISCRITMNNQATSGVDVELRFLSSGEVAHKVSDAAGYVFFDELEEGMYTLKVYAPPGAMPVLLDARAHRQSIWGMDASPSFRSYLFHDSIQITGGGMFTGECNFVPNQRLTGTVIYEDGPPAAGVVLTLDRKSDGGAYYPFRTTRTDAEGAFAMNEVPSGEYRLRSEVGGDIEPLLDRTWDVTQPAGDLHLSLRLPNPLPQTGATACNANSES